MCARLASITAALLSTWPRAALACVACRGEVDAGIYDDRFWVNLAIMLAPTLLFSGLVLAVPARLGRRSEPAPRERS